MKNKLFLSILFTLLTFESVLSVGVVDKIKLMNGSKFIRFSAIAGSLGFIAYQKSSIDRLKSQIKHEKNEVCFLKTWNNSAIDNLKETRVSLEKSQEREIKAWFVAFLATIMMIIK